MALLWMDGLDGYSSISDVYGFTYAGSAMTFGTTTGRFGGGAIFMGDVGQLIIPAPSGLEIFVGFAINMADSRNSDNIIVSAKSVGASDSGIEVAFTFNPVTGTLKIWRGQLNTLLATATITVPLNDGNWRWLDFHMLIDGSTGAAEMWVDGTSVISVTGANTMRNGGITALLGPVIGSVAVNTPHSHVDDIVVVDTSGSHNNARIGDSKIEVLQPSSDASPNNGTPSTGTDHFAVVEKTTWDAGAEFVTITNTSAQEERFGFADLGSTPSSISAVQTVNYSQKTDTGSASLETKLVSSGTSVTGGSVPLGTAYARSAMIFELDPHTSAPWTAAAVNAVTGGVVVP